MPRFDVWEEGSTQSFALSLAARGVGAVAPRAFDEVALDAARGETLGAGVFAPSPGALEITFEPTSGGASLVCPCCGGARHKLDYASPVQPDESRLPVSPIDQNQSGPTGDTIPPNTTTAFTLAMGGSQTGFVNVPGDDDWFRVELVAGQSYVFTSTGVGGLTALEDPYLELYNASGTQLLAFDDDAGPGRNAMLRFTATQSGTYYLNARAWEPDTGAELTGGYQVTANLGPPQNPLDTIDLGFSAPLHIDVYFATAGQNFFDTTVLRNWTPSEMASAMSALATYSAVTNLTFSQVGSPTGAEFILMIADLEPNVLGWFATEAGQGYGAFAPDGLGWTASGLQPGGIGWVTLLHEFGHGLGLAHPHDNGGDSEIMQGVLSEFDSFGTFLMNQGVFTTMGYNDGWTAQFGAPFVNFGNQATPMALDLGLLQIEYGANPTTNLGNTTYALPSANAAGTYFASIWDAGGVDTIVTNSASGATIDLRSATLLNETGGGGFISSNSGIRGGFTIAAGAVIENARGGAGGDSLIGNDVANLLEGGAGNDTLSGNGGDDALVGGAGNDVLNGGAGLDRAWYTDAAGAVTVSLALAGISQGTGAAGSDTLNSIEALFGSIFNDTLTGSSAGDTLVGLGGDDLLTGGAGADWIVGDVGDDRFAQGLEGGGVDRLFGDAGSDTIDYGAAGAGVTVQLSGYSTNAGVTLATFTGVENATGTAFNDVLVGNALNNRITGAAGSDWLVGQGGDDWFVQGVEGGVDRLFGDAGVDTLDYAAAGVGIVVQLVGYSTINGGALLATFTGIENAIGANLNDVLVGDAADNRITGGAGSDWLVGGAGNDTFAQGVHSGVDTIFGDAGLDAIDFSTAAAGIIVQLSGYTTTLAGALLATFSGLEAAVGSAFNDVLVGAGADNLLTGGAGADWLVGGAGADDFVYQSLGAGADTIADFSRTQIDAIDLSAIDANAAQGGDQDFTFSTARTSGLAGEIVATSTSATTTTIRVYLDADNVADQVISVIHESGLVMNADDFVL